MISTLKAPTKSLPQTLDYGIFNFYWSWLLAKLSYFRQLQERVLLEADLSAELWSCYLIIRVFTRTRFCLWRYFAAWRCICNQLTIGIAPSLM